MRGGESHMQKSDQYGDSTEVWRGITAKLLFMILLVIEDRMCHLLGD